MLACIACSKHVHGSVECSMDDDGGTPRSPATKETIKSLTHQLKGMALRFSAGAYRTCRPCTAAGVGGMIGGHDHTSGHVIDSMDILDASSEFSVGSSTHNSVGGSNLSSHYSTPTQSFKGTPSRSRRETPTSHIAHTRHPHHDSNNNSKRNGAHHDQGNSITKKAGIHAVYGKDDRKQVQEGVDANRLDHHDQSELKSGCEDEHVEVEKEWVAQVEPGVLITFVTLADGGNDLKRIRFSREMFNKWQAQQWWAENCDKVHELYNVPKFNRMPGSLLTPSRSEDESYKSQSSGEYKKLNRSYQQNQKPGGPAGKKDKRRGGHARGGSMVGDVMGGADMPSACASEWEAASEEEATQPNLSQCCSSMDRASGEEEWVQEDEPGVYITLTSNNGSRELKRIRFSREKFTEIQARIWWEENRIRVYEHYL